MKKLLFIIPSLAGGGSERVFTNILRGIDVSKFNITLLLILDEEHNNLQLIPDEISIVNLRKKTTKNGLFAIFKTIHSLKPNLVFSTLGHLNLLISFLIPFFKGKTTFIARESNTLSVHNKNEKYPMLFNFLFRTTYKRFDAIIAQSIYMKEDMINNYGIDEKKVVQIYNPVLSNFIINKSTEGVNPYDESCKNVVIVGRLNQQKRIKHAIEAADKLSESYRLHIVGEGEEREALQKLVDEKGLTGKVIMHGFQSNPYLYIKHADCLISTSRYEGLPNVVIESIILGTAVVCYDCPGGTSEVVHEGVNGYLIEDGDVNKLSKFIERCCHTELNYRSISSDAQNMYDVVHIVSSYQSLFDKLA